MEEYNQELFLIRQWENKILSGEIKMETKELSIFVPIDAKIFNMKNHYGFDKIIIETKRKGIKITYSFIKQENRNIFLWSALDLTTEKYICGEALEYVLYTNGICLYQKNTNGLIIYDDWKLISSFNLVGIPPDIEVIFDKIESHSDFFNKLIGITDDNKKIIKID